MTELFNNEGHLTRQGLQAMLGGQLDELQSLEAAEHLAFCSFCMQQYLELLTPKELVSPPHDLELPVARGVRQKQRHALSRRYATAAAAAAISLTLWGVGAFQWMAPARPAAIPPAGQTSQQMPWWLKERQRPPQPGTSATEKVTQGLDNVFDAVSRACTHLTRAITPQNYFFRPSNEMRGEIPHEK